MSECESGGIEIHDGAAGNMPDSASMKAADAIIKCVQGEEIIFEIMHID